MYVSDIAPVTISGTSYDPGGSGVTAVKAKIRRNSDNYWWSASDAQFASAEGDNNASGTNPWSINITAGLLDNVSYYVQTSARDQAGLIEAYPGYSPRTFWIDYSSPTSGITQPVDGKYYKALASLKGTASDITAGVKEAGILLQDLINAPRIGTRLRWPGRLAGIFHGFSYRNKARLQLELSNCLPFVQETRYLAVSRGKDNSEPVLTQTVFNAGVSSNSFVYDVIKPTSVITLPVNNGIYGGPGNLIGTIRGTGFDSDTAYTGGPAAAQKRVEKRISRPKKTGPQCGGM